MRTGGYHAKTPAGCPLGSTFTMIVSLEFAKRLHPVSNLICLAAASILILRLAPANNAALHLNAEESALKPLFSKCGYATLPMT